MINPKYITIAAVVGFCLSFIIGLVCGVSIGRILFRAFIFACVFALVAVGVSVVFSIFLTSSNSSSDFDSAPSGTSGSVVNITVDDDALPDDEFSPKFSVENNRKSLGVDALSDKNSESKSSDSPAAASAVASVASPAANPPNENEPAAAPAFKPSNLDDITKKSEPSSDDISDLPPIDDLPADSASGFESVNDGGSGTSSVGSKPTSSAVPEQNAQLMAQAISTILSKDEE